MKKTMIIFAAAFMFTSCGNVGNGSHTPTDSTGVKCDTCQTDTTVVVADPLPPNPPADVEPGTGTSTEPTTPPVLTVDPRDPKPQPLPNPKPKGQKS